MKNTVLKFSSIHAYHTHTHHYTNESVILFADLEDRQGLQAVPHPNLEIWLQGVSGP